LNKGLPVVIILRVITCNTFPNFWRSITRIRSNYYKISQNYLVEITQNYSVILQNWSFSNYA